MRKNVTTGDISVANVSLLGAVAVEASGELYKKFADGFGNVLLEDGRVLHKAVEHAFPRGFYPSRLEVVEPVDLEGIAVDAAFAIGFNPLAQGEGLPVVYQLAFPDPLTTKASLASICIAADFIYRHWSDDSRGEQIAKDSFKALASVLVSLHERALVVCDLLGIPATGDPEKDLAAEVANNRAQLESNKTLDSILRAIARGYKGILAASQTAEQEKNKAQLEAAREGITKGMLAGLRKMRAAGLAHNMPINEPDPNYRMAKDTKEIFNALLFQMCNNDGGGASNVLLVGDTGVGKTKLAVEFAAWVRLPLIIVEAYEHRYASAFYGGMRLIGGETIWQDSKFAQMITQGNCVVVIDEITRAEPTSVNAFFPLLDWRRGAQIDEAGKYFKVGPNVFFFATANIGSGFTGTYRMDDALQNRFGVRFDVQLPDETTLHRIMGSVLAEPKPIGDTAEKDIERWSPHGITNAVVGRMASVITDLNKTALKDSKELSRIISPREALEAAEWYCLLGPEGVKRAIIDKFPVNAFSNQRATVESRFKKVFADAGLPF
jgi:hypothetical protein